MPLALQKIADLAAAEDLTPWLKEVQDLPTAYKSMLRDAPDNHHRPPGLHASEISKCARLATYSLRGEPKRDKETSAMMQQVFDIGHLVHDKVQRDFHRTAHRSKGAFSFRHEIPIEPYTNPIAAVWQIYSHCDGLFEFWAFPPGGRPHVRLRVVLEIKTLNAEDFKALKAPEEAHIEQAHVYMACLDAPLAWILYVNKSNGLFSDAVPPFVLPFNPARWEGLERRFEVFHDNVQLDVLPERTDGFHCGWCPYADACAPEYLRKRREREAQSPAARLTSLNSRRLERSLRTAAKK